MATMNDILSIINDADPIGLIKAGAAQNEYEPQARAIEEKLVDQDSAQSLRNEIHQVFADWFDENLAGPQDRYTAIAERIWALRENRNISSADFIDWKLKTFDSLTPRELYAIMQLRNEVFSVEQNCVYQDADNKDFEAFHLMAWKQEKLVAYTRLLPPFIAFDDASIGRVVTSPAVRKTGLGRQLMESSIRAMEQLYGKIPIRIGAQLYLQKFYESMGFVRVGEPYLEDGIKHVEMLLMPQ